MDKKETAIKEKSSEELLRSRNLSGWFGGFARNLGNHTPKAAAMSLWYRFTGNINRLGKKLTQADFLAPRITTIDIGDQAVRIVEFKGLRVVRWATFAINTGDGFDANKLKTSIHEFGFKDGKAPPDNETAVRYKTVTQGGFQGTLSFSYVF